MSATIPSNQVPSSEAAGYNAISGINFTGGFPTSKDLAPSIVFVILYFISTPFFLYRVFRPQDRCLILIRPGVFLACRIGMLILRAVMSKTTYGEGELIGELVLVSIGYLFLIDPCVEMWQRHLASAITKDQYPGWVRRMGVLIRMCLIAAIALTVAGSAMISSAISDPSKLSEVKTLREAGYVLSLAVVGVLLVALIGTHVSFGLAINGTLYILVPTCCLIIVGVYRVVQVFTNNSSAPVRSTAAFYVLQITFEFFAYCFILGISIPTRFPKDGRRERTDVEMVNNPEPRRRLLPFRA